MKLFYCPKCKKEEIRNDNPYKHEETIVNIRDGYPLDGDSYSLDDLYIEWEETVEDGKLILIVWEWGELSTE